jgi:hypothetical protein
MLRASRVSLLFSIMTNENQFRPTWDPNHAVSPPGWVRVAVKPSRAMMLKALITTVTAMLIEALKLSVKVFSLCLKRRRLIREQRELLIQHGTISGTVRRA